MKKCILLPFILFGLSYSFAQKSYDQLTQHDAKRWFHKKEWLNGLQLHPSLSINEPEFYRQYFLNKKFWDEAFAFLKNKDLITIVKGKYPIDGENVFASVTEDSTKDFDKTTWESHRKYIDIQYVILGEEQISVNPVANSTVIKEYDEKKDAANYAAAGKVYVADPGTFFIFFPSDAHRPNVTTSDNKPDKKIVIKVRYAD